MLAYLADVDGRQWQATAEISDAVWLTRLDLDTALDRGELHLASPNSPGRLLVEHWRRLTTNPPN